MLKKAKVASVRAVARPGIAQKASVSAAVSLAAATLPRTLVQHQEQQHRRKRLPTHRQQQAQAQLWPAA